MTRDLELNKCVFTGKAAGPAFTRASAASTSKECVNIGIPCPGRHDESFVLAVGGPAEEVVVSLLLLLVCLISVAAVRMRKISFDVLVALVQLAGLREEFAEPAINLYTYSTIKSGDADIRLHWVCFCLSASVITVASLKGAVRSVVSFAWALSLASCSAAVSLFNALPATVYVFL